jgi:hypothetical protein
MPATTTFKTKREPDFKKARKVYAQNPLGLVKNRRTPKTFNKGKKVVWGKEYPSINKQSPAAINQI